MFFIHAIDFYSIIVPRFSIFKKFFRLKAIFYCINKNQNVKQYFSYVFFLNFVKHNK